MPTDKETYDKVYETMPDYGKVNHAGPMQAYIVDELHPKPASVLDVGCGRGDFIKFLATKGIAATGVDVSAPRPDANGGFEFVNMDVRELQPALAVVDWVTAFDFLEHLPEEELDSILEALMVRARYGMIFSICFRDSIYRCFDKSLHKTVKPAEWWKEKLSKYGEVEEWDIQPTCGFYIVRK